MLGFVQSILAPKANPIGVDFGSDCLRLAQVQVVDKDFQLIAAASADIPPHIREDKNARLEFFVQNVRELLAQAPFRGRQAVLGLPASEMHILHLRIPHMDDDAVTKAIPWEARGKLPIDPSHAVLRHFIAGEIYHEQESKVEVIVMGSEREWVQKYLATAAKAKLDVLGMNAEPIAIVDCFGHVYRRKTDREGTLLFVDIGSCGTRATISRNGKILFARGIPIGGDHFTQAVADAMKIGFDEAKALRIKTAAWVEEKAPATPAPAPVPVPAAVAAKPRTVADDRYALPPSSRQEESFALLGAGLAAANPTVVEQRKAVAVVEPPPPRLPDPDDDSEELNDFEETKTDPAQLAADARKVAQICRELVNRLASELDLCRRYHEAAFPTACVDKLVFVGGEARQASLCQHIAQELGVAAQVGDPLCRMKGASEEVYEFGIDRRSAQPAWAVAIGLSMGGLRSVSKEKES